MQHTLWRARRRGCRHIAGLAALFDVSTRFVYAHIVQGRAPRPPTCVVARFVFRLTAVPSSVAKRMRFRRRTLYVGTWHCSNLREFHRSTYGSTTHASSPLEPRKRGRPPRLICFFLRFPQLCNLAFVKTHKTGSTTLSSLFYRYGVRRGLKVRPTSYTRRQ